MIEGISNNRRLKFFVATCLILVIFTSAFFIYSQLSQGASYTWLQTSWSGGETANTASHPTNETGWTEYSAKDSNVSATTELKLNSTSDSATQTSDDDFNAGTASDTAVSSGSIVLSTDL